MKLVHFSLRHCLMTSNLVPNPATEVSGDEAIRSQVAGFIVRPSVNVKEVNLRVRFFPTWDENKIISHVSSSVLSLTENETTHIRSMKCPGQNE
jgi:hypothetical protein